MLKNIEEVKSLILWLKENKIRRLRVGEIDVEISEASMYEDSQPVEMPMLGSETMADTEQVDQQEEDELLYWSSRP